MVDKWVWVTWAAVFVLGVGVVFGALGTMEHTKQLEAVDAKIKSNQVGLCALNCDFLIRRGAFEESAFVACVSACSEGAE